MSSGQHWWTQKVALSVTFIFLFLYFVAFFCPSCVACLIFFNLSLSREVEVLQAAPYTILLRYILYQIYNKEDFGIWGRKFSKFVIYIYMVFVLMAMARSRTMSSLIFKFIFFSLFYRLLVSGSHIDNDGRKVKHIQFWCLLLNYICFVFLDKICVFFFADLYCIHGEQARGHNFHSFAS